MQPETATAPGRTNEELALTAHHEAAHFIVDASIGSTSNSWLTLIGRDENNQGSYHPGLFTLNGGLRLVWVVLAGDIAEEIYAPDTWSFDEYTNDQVLARRVMARLIGIDPDGTFTTNQATGVTS